MSLKEKAFSISGDLTLSLSPDPGTPGDWFGTLTSIDEGSLTLTPDELKGLFDVLNAEVIHGGPQ